MRGFIVAVIITSSICLAQPVNGPYIITSADSSLQISSPLAVIDSEGVLHVFYVEQSSSEFRILSTQFDARSGIIIANPSLVFSDTVQQLQLNDLALNWLGEPTLLIEESSGTRHQLLLIRPNDNASPSTILLDTLDTMHPFWGGSSFVISGARLVTIAPDYTHVVFRLTETTMTRLGDFGWCALIYEWPSVLFLSELDSVHAVFPFDQSIPFSIESEGVFTGESLSSDSLYVWLGSYYEQQRFTVDQSSGFHDAQTIDCEFGNFTGQTFQNGTRVHLRSEHYYNSPTTQVSAAEMQDSTCIYLADYYCDGVTNRAVSHPDFGFAYCCNNDVSIELVRLDSTGQLAASMGTIAWREDGWSFMHSTTAIGSDGLVAALWLEDSSDLQRQRLAFSSCEWTTPLDASEPPVPIAKNFSLTTYPNPFNSTVRIDYELPRASDIQVSIYNTLGEEVATLFKGRSNAGTHSLSWSPNSASGVYFVKLVSGDFVTSRKILYLR